MALITRKSQLDGQSALLRFAKLNPLGANLAIGPLITVLALTYGASDFQTGLLYASMHLCGVILLIMPVLARGIDASRVFTQAWLTRSVLGMAYLALPFLGGNQIKVWLLIIVYFGFMAARAIGMGASQVVFKAVTRPAELAEVVSRQSTWWYIGTIAISLLTAGILNRSAWFPTQEWAFFAILALGIPLNFAASLALRRLPPTGTFPGGSPFSLLAAIPSVWRDAERREVILLVLLTVPMGIAAGYQLNYLKVVLKLSADLVFIITIGGMFAMLGGAYLSGVVGRSIGFRPLQLGAHAMLAVCGAVMAWANLFPVHMQVALAITIFILASLCISISGTVLSALSIDRLGEQHRLETSIIFQLAATLAAGLGLGLISLARSLSSSGVPGGHLYSYACLVWTIFSLAVCWLSLRLRRPGDDAWGDIAVLHPANLMTAVRLHQVENSKDSIIERMINMESMLTNGTAVSRARLMQFLDSPDTAHRMSAYRSLYVDPVPAAVPGVMREALDPFSPLRREAITALGFLNDRSQGSVLLELLNTASPRIAATTVKTLLRLGYEWPDEVLLGFWKEWSDPADRMELLIGLSAVRQTRVIWAVVRAELVAGTPGTALRPVLLHLADALGERAEMCEIWSAESRTPGSGVRFVLDELAGKRAWSDLARPDENRARWRSRVATRLDCVSIPDDLTAASLLYLAGLSSPPGGLQ